MHCKALPMVLCWVCVLSLLSGSTIALAEPLDEATVQVIVHVPEIAILDVDRAVLVFEESDFDYASLPGTELVEQGIVITKEAALNLIARGNVAFSVLVVAENDALFSTTGGYQLPVNQLRWRVAGSGDEWMPFSTEDTAVLVRLEPGQTFADIDFQLETTWDNPAATYEGNIVYTVVPNGDDA